MKPSAFIECNDNFLFRSNQLFGLGGGVGVMYCVKMGLQIETVSYYWDY